MKLSRLRGAAVGALAVMAISGASIVLAASPTAKPTTPAAEATQPNAVDTDTLEQGDQTSPDGAEVPEATSSEAKTTAEADGPGGHADAAGEIDHQFDGNE